MRPERRSPSIVTSYPSSPSARRQPSSPRRSGAAAQRLGRRVRPRRAIAPLMPAPGEVREVPPRPRRRPGREARPGRRRSVRPCLRRRPPAPARRRAGSRTPREVVARSARDRGQLGRRSGSTAHEAVHGLVHRPVAADRHDQAGPLLAPPAAPGRRMARPLAEERLAGEAGFGGQAGELRPAASASTRSPTPGSRGRRCRNGLGPSRGRRWPRPAPAPSSGRPRGRISSSVMRTNSPSTSTSLTVSRQPAFTLRSAPSVKSTAASISTARMPRSDQRWYWPSSGL